MNRDELVEQVARNISYPRVDVERIILATLDAVINELKAGKKVNLSGFGQFYTDVRSARAGVNPRNTAEVIQVPAVTVPKFRAGKKLKDYVKSAKVAEKVN